MLHRSCDSLSTEDSNLEHGNFTTAVFSDQMRELHTPVEDLSRERHYYTMMEGESITLRISPTTCITHTALLKVLRIIIE